MESFIRDYCDLGAYNSLLVTKKFSSFCRFTLCCYGGDPQPPITEKVQHEFWDIFPKITFLHLSCREPYCIACPTPFCGLLGLPPSVGTYVLDVYEVRK